MSEKLKVNSEQWKECKLGEVAEVKYGKDHKLLPDGNIPAYGSGGIMRYVDKAIYEEESILIPRKGSLNNIFYMDKPFWTVDTIFWTKIDKTKTFPKFLFYQLSVIDYTNLNVGSAVPSLTVPVINEIDILLPPLPEQKAIAAVLSGLDDKIDLLHRQNKTLESMAEALFRQWFVEEASESWEEKVITELFEIRDGTHDSPKQKATGKPLLTSKHILSNRLDIESAYLISDEDFENVNKRSKVDTNDILFSMIGTIGLLYLEQSKNIDYAIKNIGLFKTSQNKKWTYYTYLWLKSSYGQDFIHEHRSGSTQEYISLGSLRGITFNCPPIDILNNFNVIADSYFVKINNNQSQIRTLEKMRDSLLPKLMSGEIKVKN